MREGRLKSKPTLTQSNKTKPKLRLVLHFAIYERLPLPLFGRIAHEQEG